MASDEELRAELDRLRAENEALKRPRGQTSLKVTERGALSVYGFGRFPVTLYREQWEKLLNMSDEIRLFIKDNDECLNKTKSVPSPAPPLDVYPRETDMSTPNTQFWRTGRRR